MWTGKVAGPAAVTCEPGFSFDGPIEGCILEPPGEIVFDSYFHFHNYSALALSHRRFT